LVQFADKLGVPAAFFLEGLGSASRNKGENAKMARAIDRVAASNEGVAVLEAMAEMEPLVRTRLTYVKEISQQNNGPSGLFEAYDGAGDP
jgi:hypothetical protein